MKTHDEILDNHEIRIQDLEKTDAQLVERIGNLITQMQSVTSWIKGLIVILLSGSIGFIIWYIQSIPRG